MSLLTALHVLETIEYCHKDITQVKNIVKKIDQNMVKLIEYQNKTQGKHISHILQF